MARYRGRFESGRKTEPKKDVEPAVQAQTPAPVSAESGSAAPESEKKRRGMPAALIVLIVFTLALGSLALSVALRGKSMRTSSASETPYIPQTAQPREENPAAPQTEKIAELEGDDLLYNGKRYRYNEDVVTFLLLGIDREAPDAYNGDCNVMAFSDVVMLAAMDYRNNRISFFTVSRDAMCQYTKLDRNGIPVVTATGQLAIPFSYGDGKLKSLEVTKNAVSGLFGGLKIYSCSALYLDGLGELNDAIGGVTLTPIESLHSGSLTLEEGKQVTLDAAHAELYIRSRHHTVEGNLIRMERQKHYFKTLVTQLLAACRKEMGTVVRVYNAIKDDVVTDLDFNDILYLAATATKMQVTGDVVNVPGTVILGENDLAEFYIDEAGFFELLLSIYYEEQPQS